MRMRRRASILCGGVSLALLLGACADSGAGDELGSDEAESGSSDMSSGISSPIGTNASMPVAIW